MSRHARAATARRSGCRSPARSSRRSPRGYLGDDADARDDEVAGHPDPAGRHDPRANPVSPPRTEPPRPPTAARTPLPRWMRSISSAPICSPTTALQRVLAAEDAGDLDPELREGGCHLASDEAHADDHRAPAGPGLPLDRLTAGLWCAGSARPAQVRAGQPERARLAPGGDQQAGRSRVSRPRAPAPRLCAAASMPVTVAVRRSTSCSSLTIWPAGRTSRPGPPPSAGRSWTAAGGRTGRQASPADERGPARRSPAPAGFTAAFASGEAGRRR